MTALVISPFIMGMICYMAGRRDHKVMCLISDLTCSAAWLYSLVMLLSFGNAAAGLEMGEYVRTFHIDGICGFGLSFGYDGMRLIYVSIACFMWMIASLAGGQYFEGHKNSGRFYMFLLFTLGATLGVLLSTDLLSLYVFFEIMSFTSYCWVVQEEDDKAMRAGATYLAIAVIGGLIMLMGLFLLYYELGTLEIAQIKPLVEAAADKGIIRAAGICILAGFAAKAGLFPLHIWLPKAHPASPAPASALLSGILTKTGVFGVLITCVNIFADNESFGMFICTLAMITMFLGAFLGLFSTDLKRTLACSSMSQIGFIMTGIGTYALLKEERTVAAFGTILHMMNHSLIKLVLFLCAGVVFMNTKALDLNSIRGFGRNKKLLMAIFAVGALSISGIPLFSGYISKSLLHEAITSLGQGGFFRLLEWTFLISGGMTLCYMLKLFICIFIERNNDEELQRKYDEDGNYMNPVTGTALFLSAVILFILGLMPHGMMERAAAPAMSFMDLKGQTVNVHYFGMECLKGSLISIAAGVMLYIFFIRRVLMKRHEGDEIYLDRWPKWLDLEELIYRPVFLYAIPAVLGLFFRIFDSLPDTFIIILRKTILKDSPVKGERLEGTALTELCGNLANFLRYRLRPFADSFIEKYFNKAGRGRMRQEITGGMMDGPDYRHVFAMEHVRRVESNRVIERSMSYGLMLFGAGFAIMMIYMIGVMR